jgi:hypothetical protein
MTQGAEAFGCRGHIWTTARVGEMIRQQFGVSAPRAHGSCLLRRITHRRHKPIQKATQREETARVAWKEERWPALNKRTSVCVHPSALSLLPMAVSTDAPVGKTPVLNIMRTRDPLLVLGATTQEGTIVMQTHDQASTGPDVVRCVPVLTRESEGTVRVLWDGALVTAVTRSTPSSRRREPRACVSTTCLALPQNSIHKNLDRMPANSAGKQRLHGARVL